MSAHLGVPLEDLEDSLNASEALAAGLFVAEAVLGDEVMRCYGTTEQEARDRLDYDLSQLIIVRDPAAKP